MPTAQIIAIISKECDWVLRYPRIPEITADSPLDWMSPVDRVCAQMAIDEAFGVELDSDKFDAVDCVADIAGMVAAKQKVCAA